MAQLLDVVRRAVAASAFVPDAVLAMCIVALALGVIRILGLGWLNYG